MTVPIIGEGGPRDPARLGLDTRRGRPIENHRRREQRPERLEAAQKHMISLYPVKPRTVSATYSCVSLVFACRRTWVEIDQLPLVLADDGYRSIPLEEVVDGDIVTYAADETGFTHVGLVMACERMPPKDEGQLWILSQWGQDGEYFHRPGVVPPRYGNIRRYWTERSVRE